MMEKKLLRLLSSGVAALPLVGCAEQENRPNVLFILADDLGYGDLSCLGQSHFETPNIDRLASEGVLFTQHYSGSPVSAPSRSVLLTGLHSGHTQIRGNKEMPGEGQQPLPSETYTLFDLFKGEGYATGLFGKWGLGYPGSDGTPAKHGVDDFYGYNCQRYSHSYYPDHLWDNDTKVVLEGNKDRKDGEYAPHLIHDQALEFLRANKKKPFFMVYASVLPHAELKAPKEDMDRFGDTFEPEIPFKGVDDGPYYRKGNYESQSRPHTAFAAMVTILDRQVGELMAELEKLGVADNTIVVFTSDNGPHQEGGADPDFFDSNACWCGYKRDLYEGGIRVPFIVKWPGVTAEGERSEHLSAFWDFMPTMADVLDVELPVETDGISYLPELQGLDGQPEHDYLYWEFHEAGGRQAVRKGDWKAVVNNIKSGRKVELYNLSEDPSETNDLSESYPEKTAYMDSLMKVSHTPSESFPFPGDK